MIKTKEKSNKKCLFKFKAIIIVKLEFVQTKG